MFIDEMKQAAEGYGLSLTEQQLGQFNRYYELLIAWNENINLTAITEPHEVAVKHMIDSLTAYREELFPAGASVIDVGTGAGFPGLPLKIFCPGIHLTLMDSLNKRVKFLQTVVGELGLTDVECIHARAEEGARMPFVRRGGYFLALKGAQYQEEADEAKKAIKVMGGSSTEIRTVSLPGLADQRAIVEIHKTMPTPKTYPRKAGTPAKKPIIG